MNSKKVAFVVAYEGYQQVEYEEPKKILEDLGFTVVTVSNKSGAAIAKDGSTATVDVTLDELNIDDYDGIIFIGGPGALDHLDNKTSYSIIKKAAQDNKPLGAICISTRILAHSGVLTGRRATGWNGDGKLPGMYKDYNIDYTAEKIVVDDTFITATDPSVAKQFGEAIVRVIQGQHGWG